MHSIISYNLRLLSLEHMHLSCFGNVALTMVEALIVVEAAFGHELIETGPG